MSQINFDDFVAGGYFIAKYAERAECFSADLLPSQIISASDCIVDLTPKVFTTESLENPKKQAREAYSYKVSKEELPKILQWVNERYDRDIGFPNTFYSVETAREFAHQLYDTEALTVLGIGLHKNSVSEFLEEEQAGYGVYEQLKANKLLAKGGEVLGFEVLGYDYGGFHSWLCNGLEEGIYKEFNIRPNNRGFIQTLDEASKAAEYASRDEVGAEPALWQSWLVMEYNMKAKS